MPRACSVCTHDEAAAITKALSAGVSVREISLRFVGVSAAAAHRHLQNCLRIRRAEKPAKELEQADAQGEDKKVGDSSRFDRSGAQDPANLVKTAARLVGEALDLLEHAKRADDRRTALVALREARDGLSLLMKTAGMLQGEGASTFIDARKQTVAVLGSMTTDEIRDFLRRTEPIEGEVVQPALGPAQNS